MRCGIIHAPANTCGAKTSRFATEPHEPFEAARRTFYRYKSSLKHAAVQKGLKLFDDEIRQAPERFNSLEKLGPIRLYDLVQRALFRPATSVFVRSMRIGTPRRMLSVCHAPLACALCKPTLPVAVFKYLRLQICEIRDGPMTAVMPACTAKPESMGVTG